MDPAALDFLKSLLATPTPSGAEDLGMRLAAKYVADVADEVFLDLHGNLHATFNTKAGAAVVLEAHCDEIGFIVQHVDDRGFIYLAAVGGVQTALLPGERIAINGRRGTVYGVFGARPPHLSKGSQEPGSIDMTDLALDIGASSRDEALGLVRQGDFAVVDAGWRQLAGDRVAARGLDDRIGVFAQCEAFRAICKRGANVAVRLLLTVQEELGHVGATTALHDYRHVAGICVDVGHASDTPASDRRQVGIVDLGKGPIVPVGPTYNPKLAKFVADTAEKCGIATQCTARPKSNTNDAWPMRLEHGGIATQLISIPIRYMHSPVETMCLADVEATSRLIEECVCTLPANPSFAPDPL